MSLRKTWALHKEVGELRVGVVERARVVHGDTGEVGQHADSVHRFMPATQVAGDQPPERGRGRAQPVQFLARRGIRSHTKCATVAVAIRSVTALLMPSRFPAVWAVAEYTVP